MRTHDFLMKRVACVIAILVACSIGFAHAELLTAPAWDEEIDQYNAGFGISVSGAGDVNGDGWNDVIVGATGATLDGITRSGGIFIYYGSATGLSVEPATIAGPKTDSYFGSRVSRAGDVNGDGYDDVVVGAYFYTIGTSKVGRVWVYYGSASGLSPTDFWAVDGDQANSQFGYSVSGAGNVNGDAFDDIIVGAPYYDGGNTDEGRVYVYHGSADGPSPAPIPWFESDQTAAMLGYSVSGAGNVNGDEFDDIIVGAFDYHNVEWYEGAAFVFHGSASGLYGSPVVLEINQTSAHFGSSVSGAGDVNGDGWDDVIVGASHFTDGQSQEGAAFVFHGSDSGPVATGWAPQGEQSSAWYGSAVSGAGDVNGDGYDDVIVGAPDYWGAKQYGGKVDVFYGGPSGLSLTADWTQESTSSYSAAHFGASVSSAGDVNGDYVADIIVGAPGEKHGQTGEGRAYVYHGKTDYMVKNADDGGLESLRQALLDREANTSVGATVINFEIPGTEVHTIQPGTALPTITRPVIINGYSQSGASPNTNAPDQGTNATLKIELNGNSLSARGLHITTQGGCVVRGLVINRFQSVGIEINGTLEGSIIEGNFIGTDPTGTIAHTHTQGGIHILNASNNMIGGTAPAARNVISGNGGNGVPMTQGATQNMVLGNLIGTERTGTAALGNGNTGVVISGSFHNTIGGSAPGAGNVISGNVAFGVSIKYFASDNVVSGNYIGTDVTGMAVLGNLASGVGINDAANNTVGGASDADRNIISGNKRGISVTATSTGNVIQGNYIGTDVAGLGAIGNTLSGILFHEAPDNVVRNNVISGNDERGIYLHAADGNVLEGNLVGTDKTGTARLPNKGGYAVLVDHADGSVIGGTTADTGNVIAGNDGAGIRIYNYSSGTILQRNYIGTNRARAGNLGNLKGVLIDSSSPNHTIGGTTTDLGNTIAYNTSFGVAIYHESGNAVLSNSIFSNGALGIDLDGGGVTANDEVKGDGDTGGNGLQNFPAIDDAYIAGARGTFNSTPETTFTLQFFANGACDPSGYGEGETLLDELVIVTDTNGDATFDHTFGGATAEVGQFITATATSEANNTSEFSACVEAHDGDGIADAIDTNVEAFSNEFTDGTTSGEITIRGDQVLTITDEPDPAGVLIVAGEFGGAETATVTACAGDSIELLDPNDSVLLTCGSTTVTTLTGSVEMTFVGAGGALATATLDAGNTLTFEPETFTITAPSTNPDVVVVVIDGVAVPLPPGGTAVGSGSIAGSATADCPAAGTALHGVEIDAYETWTGDLVASTVTDADGHYSFSDLMPGDYTITVVTPLSYGIESEDLTVRCVHESVVAADFALTCTNIVPSQRSQGFWKHHVGVALGGNGNAQIDGTTLCEYLDLVEAHFNSNEINQVVVYDPPASDLCNDKLTVAKDLLNLKGKQSMEARAKQQLMALLLNVASAKLSLTEIISTDGATVSQAITYCDILIDDPAGDHEKAKTICDKINKAKMVPADMIPLDTENIAYSPAGPEPLPDRLALHQNAPNPFNPTTVIRYDVPAGGAVSLRIYDVTGALIRTLVDGSVSPGHKSATWDGADGRGNQVSSGIYFYRLVAGNATFTKKMVFLK